jgi:hypothetical protein
MPIPAHQAAVATAPAPRNLRRLLLIADSDIE